MADIVAYAGGEFVKNYRLRDWLVSRQRYWGCPITYVYDPEGNAHSCRAIHLPWTLPETRISRLEPQARARRRSRPPQNSRSRVTRHLRRGMTPEYTRLIRRGFIVVLPAIPGPTA